MNQTLTSQQISELRNGCVALIAGVEPPYGHKSSLYAGIIFVALFGLSMFTHIFQAFRFRRLTSIVFVVGALAELLGWIARTWSSLCPYNRQSPIVQTITFNIAPLFFMAGAYIILGKLIVRVGPKSSLLSPRKYLYIFVSCGVVSVVGQVVGGVLASIALDNLKDTTAVMFIMLAGYILQLVSLMFFALLFLDFLRRILRDFGLTKSELAVVCGMSISLVTLLIRLIFRTIIVAKDWDGYVNIQEPLSIGLDSAMMVLAVGVYNVIDPALLLRSPSPEQIAQRNLRDSYLSFYSQSGASSFQEEVEEGLRKPVKELKGLEGGSPLVWSYP